LWLALFIFWLFHRNTIHNSTPTVLSKISSASLFGDFFETPNQLSGVDWTLRIEILFYACCAIWLMFRGHRGVQGNEVRSWKRIGAYTFILFLLINLPIFPRNGFTGYVTIFGFIFLGGIWLALFDLKKVTRFEALFVLFSSFAAHVYAISSIRPDLHSLGAFSFYGYFAFIVLFLTRHKLPSSKIIIQLSSLTYLVYLFHNWLLNMFFVWFQFVPTNPDGRIPLMSRSVSLVIFIGAMWVIHNYFEKPILVYGKKLSSKGKTIKAAR
jgi:hypothetical protein